MEWRVVWLIKSDVERADCAHFIIMCWWIKTDTTLLMEIPLEISTMNLQIQLLKFIEINIVNKQMVCGSKWAQNG